MLQRLAKGFYQNTRLYIALGVSLLLHLLLLFFLMKGDVKPFAQDEGVSGLNAGRGLHITLSEIAPLHTKADQTDQEQTKQEEVPKDSLTSSSQDSTTLKLSNHGEQAPENSFNETAVTELLSNSNEKADQGFGGSKGEQKHYYATVLSILNKHKRYHKVALQRELEGESLIHFSIAKDGSLLEHGVLKSSGEYLLDQSALQMLQDAAPFPAFPESLDKEMIQIELPVAYSLDNRQ
jgi:TonB family protein